MEEWQSQKKKMKDRPERYMGKEHFKKKVMANIIKYC